MTVVARVGNKSSSDNFPVIYCAYRRPYPMGNYFQVRADSLCIIWK